MCTIPEDEVANAGPAEVEVNDPDYGDLVEVAPEDKDQPMEFEEPGDIQQRMLQRCRVNMGHPMKPDFVPSQGRRRDG